MSFRNRHIPLSVLLAATLVVGAHSVKDLLALARARPAEIAFASSGNGTASHLAGVLMMITARINMTHVPYKTSPPALADLLGGHVQVMFATLPSMLPQVQAGRLRALAVTSLARTPMLLQVPTMAESGLPLFIS